MGTRISGTGITAFSVDVPEADLTDLRDRLRRTRWPDPETAGGWEQGAPLDYTRELCRYWLEDYDWPAARDRLNGFPQFTTAIDGLDIHFLHVRSPHENAVPLVLTHGWPGSVVEFRKVIGPLTDPVAHGGDAADAFHVVCPSLPGFGFSGKPDSAGWNAERIADAWDELMGRLGYARYGAQGGDWGYLVTMNLGRRHPDHVLGIHLNMVIARPPGNPSRNGASSSGASGGVSSDQLSERERDALAAEDSYRDHDSGYAKIQSTRPQAVGYGLVDSPAALCAWITEKFRAWSDCDGDPGTVFTRDELLDNIMLYWLPATGASSARIYWESFRHRNTDPVPVPAGCTVFPKDIHRPPRHWAEPQFPDLRYWSEPDRGGHFAAFERPETFVSEVRAAFRAFS
jgi:pimeloyl-ACP methyl ester carboxylesterase